MDCPVCLTAYEETRRPRTLPCGHTLCTPCLNDLMEQRPVTCPTCRAENPVPVPGEFPINYALEDILKRQRVSEQVEDLRRLPQHARDLLQRGALVFAVHTTAGQSRQASLSLEDDRVYLHCLRDQPLPRGAVTLQVDDVAAAAPPCTAFLTLRWKGVTSGPVLIHVGRDNPLARQFVLLCTGQRGPSYRGSRLLKVWNEGLPGEWVRGGDYDQDNGSGGAALLPDLDKGGYSESCMAGVVGGEWGDRAQGAQFCIITKDWPGHSVSHVIGKVQVGLDVVREAVRQDPITEVTVVDCGVVVD